MGLLSSDGTPTVGVGCIAATRLSRLSFRNSPTCSRYRPRPPAPRGSPSRRPTWVSHADALVQLIGRLTEVRPTRRTGKYDSADNVTKRKRTPHTTVARDRTVVPEDVDVVPRDSRARDG